MKFTAADLRRMREAREKRIASVKADSKHENREYLITSNLAPKSKIWFPEKNKPEEVMMRIVDFMVTKEQNVGADKPGAFVPFRHFRTHDINRNTFVCPSEYGHDCPLCEYYYAHRNEVSPNDKNSPVIKMRPKKVLLANIFIKLATPGGKVVIAPRVMRCSEFFFMSTFNKKLASEETFAPTKTQEIYGFDDLESGYWMTARFSMAEAVEGSGTKFMQLVDVNLDWKNPSPVDASLYEYITDLDLLIPDAPSTEEINRMMGGSITTTATAVEEDEVVTEAEETPEVEEEVEVEVPIENDEADEVAEPEVPGEEPVDDDFDFELN